MCRSPVCSVLTPLRIGAQAHLERFYNGFGFAKASEPYDEDGILHIEMHHKGNR